MKLKELIFYFIDYNGVGSGFNIEIYWGFAGATTNDLICKFPEVENNIDCIVELLVKKEILKFTDE